jgi:antitoxin PrlF
MTDPLNLGDLAHEDVPGSLKSILEDIAAHPERVTPLDAALAQRVLDLVKGVEIDLDAPLAALDE